KLLGIRFAFSIIFSALSNSVCAFVRLRRDSDFSASLHANSALSCCSSNASCSFLSIRNILRSYTELLFHALMSFISESVLDQFQILHFGILCNDFRTVFLPSEQKFRFCHDQYRSEEHTSELQSRFDLV